MMLINELRDALKKYNEEELRFIIAEMYKAIPKQIKEGKNLDAIINNLEDYKQSGKEKKVKPIDFPPLKQAIEQFGFLALNGLYFSPNQIVRKNERSKWRFKVKAFVKDLETFKIFDEKIDEVARLFEILYHVLSQSCGYHLLSSTEPFHAIGMTQPDFLEKVFIRKYERGLNEDKIKSGIELAINGFVDSETLPEELLIVFIKYMKTNDAKMMAIEQCKLLREEIINQKAKERKKTTLNYEQINKLNLLTQLIFRLHANLKEFEEGITFFNDHLIEQNPEVTLFMLLNLLYGYDQKDWWIKVYNQAVKKRIKPREKIMNIYQQLQETGSFPEVYLI
jgi:hypothetical protein